MNEFIEMCSFLVLVFVGIVKESI